MKNTRQVGLILGPVLFFLIRMGFHPDGVSAEANAVFATTVWMAVWWITEAVAIEVTALLPVVLFPLTRRLPTAISTYFYIWGALCWLLPSKSGTYTGESH
jgi:solute carrier family 13 (sodium-dependent dicarboxylate transporter), member 2/3/5